MNGRCNVCANCAQLDKVRRSVLAGVSRGTAYGRSAGETGALIWNSALRDFPCTAQPAAAPLVAGRDCLCNTAEIAAGREIECLACSRAVKPPAPQW